MRLSHPPEQFHAFFALDQIFILTPLHAARVKASPLGPPHRFQAFPRADAPQVAETAENALGAAAEQLHPSLRHPTLVPSEPVLRRRRLRKQPKYPGLPTLSCVLGDNLSNLTALWAGCICEHLVLVD